MPTRLELTGQRFGRWTVLREGERVPGSKLRRWLCRCDCGTEAIRYQGNLRDGKTTRCRRCSNVTHGHCAGRKKTPDYTRWADMIARCYNPAYTQFKDYGGRGIRVCQRWRESFEAFLDDIGPAPSRMHTIGRVDNDGDYEPTNVAWQTRREQQNNTRRSRRFLLDGKEYTVPDLSRLTGIHVETLRHRLIRRGLPVKLAILPPSARCSAP
jgi:hypothetical protein